MNNYRFKNLRPLLFFVPLLFLPLIAHAHPVHAASFGGGLHHPFSGIDHIMVMLAVGIAAARLGGKALWSLPATFSSLTLIGALFLSRPSAPFAAMVAFSLSALLFAILFCAGFTRRMGALLALIAGVLGLLHGWGHGLGVSADLAGLVVGTVLLQLWGITVGLLTRESFPRLLTYGCSAMVLTATMAAWLL